MAKDITASVLKGLFDPEKQAALPMGQLGALAGERGGRYGHLGEKFAYKGAYQEAYDEKDHFDPTSWFDVSNHFDPTTQIKRY
jgi:hypothetical protein